MTVNDPAPVRTILSVQGLHKSFAAHLSLGRTRVLKGVDLEVRRGEIYGLLGPNGAGKTTTLKLILGLLRPDKGTITLFGLPSSDPASRRKVGFLPENPYFYDYLTAREFLDFYARLLAIPKDERRRATETLIGRVGLTGAIDKPLRKFSKGMIQRIGLAQALLGDPDFVVLDEPMSGLDPIGRREFRDVILSLRAAGKTVFFSSHILQDAEMICDRIGIMKDGVLVREGELAALLDSGAHAFEVTISGDGAPPGAGWSIVQRRGQETLLRVEGADALQELLRALALNGTNGAGGASGTRVIAVSPLRRSLEEIFLKEIRDGSARSPGGPATETPAPGSIARAGERR